MSLLYKLIKKYFILQFIIVAYIKLCKLNLNNKCTMKVKNFFINKIIVKQQLLSNVCWLLRKKKDSLLKQEKTIKLPNNYFIFA